VDVSWIPGDADAVVVAICAVLAVGGASFGIARRSGGKAQDVSKSGGPAETANTSILGSVDDEEAAASGRKAPAPSDVASSAPTTTLFESPESTSGRFGRLRGRLGATLGNVFRKSAISADDYDELEEALLLADVGAMSTDVILESVKSRLAANADLAPHEALRAALLEVIDPDADRSLALGEPGEGEAKSVIVVGVNGVGKTTTVGKLARVLVADGYSVVLGAADTFRAAAADQLETWGARVGVPVERSERDGADPASVAFAAAERAKGDGADAVLIDTAGRLQNKAGLMDELGKIVRVVGKVSPKAEVLLVLDATTGQNGLTQARVFAEATEVTGIVLTKLDGSAKGGIVVAVQRELGVPVKFVGLGEGADDLAPFDPVAFVDSLVGEA